jgi:hypothetical protein
VPSESFPEQPREPVEEEGVEGGVGAGIGDGAPGAGTAAGGAGAAEGDGEGDAGGEETELAWEPNAAGPPTEPPGIAKRTTIAAARRAS